jgi:hypothetical protein
VIQASEQGLPVMRSVLAKASNTGLRKAGPFRSPPISSTSAATSAYLLTVPAVSACSSPSYRKVGATLRMVASPGPAWRPAPAGPAQPATAPGYARWPRRFHPEGTFG